MIIIHHNELVDMLFIKSCQIINVKVSGLCVESSCVFFCMKTIINAEM